MALRDRPWYPYFIGGLILLFWLVAAAMPWDFPSWRQGVLIGAFGAVVTTWTEGLRRDRRLRGQDEQNMGVDYRA